MVGLKLKQHGSCGIHTAEIRRATASDWLQQHPHPRLRLHLHLRAELALASQLPSINWECCCSSEAALPCPALRSARSRSSNLSHPDTHSLALTLTHSLSHSLPACLVVGRKTEIYWYREYIELPLQFLLGYPSHWLLTRLTGVGDTDVERERGVKRSFLTSFSHPCFLLASALLCSTIPAHFIRIDPLPSTSPASGIPQLIVSFRYSNYLIASETNSRNEK